MTTTTPDSDLLRQQATTALDRAIKTWERREHPDRSRTIVKGKHGAPTLQVTIQHRETFPSGGQTFDAYVRSEPYADTDLVVKVRLSLVYDMVDIDDQWWPALDQPADA